MKLDFKHANPGLSLLPRAQEAQALLEGKSCKGAEFLGWLDLPEKALAAVAPVEEAAREIRKNHGLIVVGIGGSYLGARAVIEALSSGLPQDTSGFPVIFAGQNMDSVYHQAVLSTIRGKKYAINVISKSGTTTEPGLAFRILLSHLEANHSADEIAKLVFVTTDASKGSLRPLVKSRNWTSFIIPDDVGGRFSVLTPVGLLPIAAAGKDIRKLLEGAKSMADSIRKDTSANNLALQYACYRNAAYASGKKIELFLNYQPGLHFIAEWWKQLYGESEGKEGKGIFPASVDFSSDLHSMGQWIQEAERTLFETVIDVEKPSTDIKVPSSKVDDGLEYLAGRSLHDINRIAIAAVQDAHQEGQVPSMRILLPEMNEFHLGGLLYFFEYACAVSGIMLGVNPFDQPGVEAYKKTMFKMLGKPGA
ncbi:MAG: glucose-6-phosphate isomerase [Leptospirales bacterium]|nr:glucose-6-phosphate isomerase [Leptospirales bacterium]